MSKESKLIRQALEKQEQEKQNVVVDSQSNTIRQVTSSDTNETQFLSTEGRLFQKLQDHENYMLKITPPGVEYNRSADPTYVRLFVDLSYERRRINEMRQEQYKIDREQAQLQGRETYYQKKLASESPVEKAARLRNEEQLSLKYQQKRSDLESEKKNHISTMNNFFRAFPEEIEELRRTENEAHESPCWSVITEDSINMSCLNQYYVLVTSLLLLH